MKVVLAGKNSNAACLEKLLSGKGVEVIRSETAEELKGSADCPVILLCEEALDKCVTDKEAALAKASVLKPSETVVYLLDKDCEATAQAESMAIDSAAYLASKKRRVAFLMRSSRSSDMSFEDRYMRARQLGVTFIKYESLEIEANEDRSVINICDGKLKFSVETPLIIDCSPSVSPEYEAFVKTLKLRTYGESEISGGRWFLNGGETFKRDVKVVDSSADIAEIVPSILNWISGLDSKAQEKTAFVDIKKCAFCYTCHRLCPHSALVPDEDAAAMKVNPNLCAACGICVSVCPASAIEFKGGDVSETVAGKGKLKVFCCENSAFIASDEALNGVDASVEPVSCGGDMSFAKIAGALESYDNVLVAVCCDDACKHLDGNKRLIAQIERLKAGLEKTGQNPNRVSCVQTGVTMVNILKDAADTALSGGVKK